MTDFVQKVANTNYLNLKSLKENKYIKSKYSFVEDVTDFVQEVANTNFLLNNNMVNIFIINCDTLQIKTLNK